MCDDKKQTTASAELIRALPSIFWVVLAAVAFSLLFAPIKDFSFAVAARIKAGAQAEIGPLKLEAIKVSSEGSSPPSSTIEVAQDPSLESKRQDIYKKNKYFFVAHRLYPSIEAGQTYDIWVYIVPHKKTIEEIESVSYYFGSEHWGNRVYTSKDRGKSYGIAVSAYGPMLSLVTIKLKSGEVIETSSYIDFENGSLGNRGGV